MIAEVIVPLPLKGSFSYVIPPNLASQVRPGHRVIVPFGRKKFYTGIVASLSTVMPEGYEVKEIAAVLDDTPVLRRPQMQLWQWVADYYMAGIGDVYKAAVPAGLKVESETFVELSPDYEDDGSGEPMGEAETIIVQLLDHEQKRLTVADIEKKTGLKRVTSRIASLLQRGAVIISERLVERYRSRRVVYVSPTFASREELHSAFDMVKGAPKQESALLALVEMSRGGNAVTRRELMERVEVSPAIIAAMEKKGVVTLYKRTVNRFQYDGLVDPTLPVLTDDQARALRSIHESWKSSAVTVLHGVTSSGKTEVYIHLIDYVLRQGRQALLLVPEIALTTQLTHRLHRVFGGRVIVYHSKFSDNERVDLWRRMLELKGSEETARVIVGARSAVFLPFSTLGLVIVDEEHDSSYKQSDPAPRYNGRDTAIMLASMHGAKTLLASATPAVDTYYKALTGKYSLVTLSKRYGDMPMPRVEIVSMKEVKGNPGPLAPITRRHILDALGAGHQGIVFINRRGYSPMARCSVCSHVPRCTQCDVSLTYHRAADRLVCHYCGATYPMPRVCPACKEPRMEIVGYGSERVEDEVAATFPNVTVARMDLDTTRAKSSYESLIDDFSKGKARILVGTQMVTKGLDFDNVTVVAVIGADTVLHYPDFRSSEQAFDMLEQVSGRAGRRDSGAVVAIQTYDPANPIFQHVVRHDYRGFYDSEITQRQEFGYPPFTRLIYLYLKHPDDELLSTLAANYATYLRQLLGTRIVGPDTPAVSRIKGMHIRRIMIKLEGGVSLARVKALLIETRDTLMCTTPAMRQARIYHDVDPM